MAEVTIQGSGVTDNYMNANAATTNNGTNVLEYVGENNGEVGSIYRTLIKFDLSVVSPGSTINSAVLTLTVGADVSSNDRIISVFRVKRAWVETQATWNVWSTGNNWTSAGCADTTDDREAADIGTQTQINNPTLDVTTTVITLTSSKIEEMIPGGSFTNNGFLLKVATETDDGIGYHSTDAVTSSYRPKLVIDYTPLPSTISKDYALFI